MTKDESWPTPYQFQCEKQLCVAENDDRERDREAEAEEEHHKGFTVKLVACCIPVWSTGALHSLWDVSGERKCIHTYSILVWYRNLCEDYESMDLCKFKSTKKFFTLSSCTHLLQPTRGGTAAHRAQTQVSAQNVKACSDLKAKFPSGLQITSHLSNAMTARDQRLTMPENRQK